MLTRTILSRRAKTVADEALQRVFQVASGGIEPTPAKSFIINMNKGGNDATGDGSDERPFLTFAKSLAVAKALPLTAAQQAVLLIGPGTYIENPVWPPFVWGTGIQSGYDQCIINGTVSLDMPAWAAAVQAQASLSFVTITGDLVLNFTGATGFSFFATPLIIVLGNVPVTGDPVNGGEFLPSNDGTIAGLTTITGATLTSLGTQYLGGVSILSTAAQAASWSSNGDMVGVGPGTPDPIIINSTAGMTAGAYLTASGVVGPLNLVGAGTDYEATAGGIPPVVNRSAGAPAPILLTEANGIGFTATVPGNWVGAAPTNLHDAVNRIANNVGNAHPIP